MAHVMAFLKRAFGKHLRTVTKHTALRLAGAVSGLAVALTTQAQAALELDTIRYQSYSGGQVIAAELAEALGYLAPLQLKRLGTVTGGPADIQATATGQVDFGHSFNGAIINAIAAGAPVKAVLGYHGANDIYNTGAWVLEDSPIRQASDLVDRKLSVNTLGAAQQAFIEEYLKRSTLSEAERKRVTLVPIPPPNAEQALRQGQLDVALLGGGFEILAQQRGGLRRLFSDHQLFGDYTYASVVLSEAFIEKNPNTTRHLIAAMAKAIDWSQQQPHERVIALYSQYLQNNGRADQVQAVQLWRTQAVKNQGGVIAPEEFGRWLSWLEAKGTLKPGQLQVERLYTNAFNPFAQP